MSTLTVVLLCLPALAICTFARRIGRALSVIDMPSGQGGRKTHRVPTPLVGGLAIFVPVASGLVLCSGDYGFLGPLAGCYAAMLILGLLDDRQHISPYWRLGLAAAFLAVTLVLAPDLGLQFLLFSFLDQPLFLEGWGAPFSILCLIGLQNAVNMADGKNGIVLGMTLIWSLTMLWVAGPALAAPLLLLAVSVSVVLGFNLRGKLFIGDSGSYSLSILIGLLSIALANHRFAQVQADLVVVWFLVPVLDCLRLILTRSLQGRGPFSPDRTHLHHYLYAVTPSWRYGLTIYLSLVGMPIVLSLAWPELTLLWLLAGAAAYVGLFLTARHMANQALAPA